MHVIAIDPTERDPVAHGRSRPNRKAVVASVALHLAVICALFLLPREALPVAEIVVPVEMVTGAAGTAGGRAGGGGGSPAAEAAEPAEPTKRAQTVAEAEPATQTQALPEPPQVPPQPITPTPSQTLPDPPQVLPQAIVPTPVTQPPPKPRPAPRRPPVVTATNEAPPPVPPWAAPTPVPAPAPEAVQAPAPTPTPGPAATVPGPQPGTAATGTAASGPGGATGSGLGNSGSGAGLAGSREGPGDDYFERLRRHLARYKTYPPEAVKRKQEGVAQVDFTLARDGTVLAAQILKSSGFPLIDQAILDMMRNGSPVPPLPPRFTADRIQIAMPVTFSLSFLSRIF